MNKKSLSIFEKLGWNYVEYGDYACLSKYSEAGEDFSFDIPIFKSTKELIEELDNYYMNFDVVEHAKMNDGANGAPDIETLIEDAKSIENDLKILVDSLKNGKVISEKRKKLKNFLLNPIIRVKKTKKYGFVLEIKLNNKLIKRVDFLENYEDVLYHIDNFYKDYLINGCYAF